jgi:vancomycin resistance protein VanW
MFLKNLLPKSIRLAYQLCRRWLRDQRAKINFAQPNAPPQYCPVKLTIRQNILHAQTNLGKVENMRLAGVALSQIVVQPNEVLSFWRAVGNPSARRGFHKSRNLVGGVLQEDYGGGLCQVSGILYLSALTVGMTIVERHSHSVDIYVESERFVPLGGDATVVFGYKDLRLQNNFEQPIHFKVYVENGQLVCETRANTPLSIFELKFNRTDFVDKRTVETWQKQGKTWLKLGKSTYKLLKNK